MKRAHGELYKPLNLMRVTLGAGPTATRVGRRENTGVVQESFFSKNVQDALILLHYGKTGSAIADDGRAGHLLQNSLRPPDILAEFLRRLIVDQAMEIPMAGHFVAFLADRLD